MRGFPGSSGVKNRPVMPETMGIWVPSLGLGRSPGGGNGHPLQYPRPIPCVEEPVGSRRVGRTEWLNTHCTKSIRTKKMQEETVITGSTVMEAGKLIQQLETRWEISNCWTKSQGAGSGFPFQNLPRPRIWTRLGRLQGEECSFIPRAAQELCSSVLSTQHRVRVRQG